MVERAFESGAIFKEEEMEVLEDCLMIAWAISVAIHLPPARFVILIMRSSVNIPGVFADYSQKPTE